MFCRSKLLIEALQTKIVTLHKSLAMETPFYYKYLEKNPNSKKVCYPSADRNKEPILEVLKRHIAADVSGHVLEVSSGSGQHVAHFSKHFPRLTFHPTERDVSMLDSIREYVAEAPHKNIRDPLELDVLHQPWDLPPDVRSFEYVININLIHVSPFECTLALFRNCGKLLRSEGLLFTYGAFAEDGRIEPESNKEFDAMIRRQHPEWGLRDVRDVEAVAADNGIVLLDSLEMPSNNKCIVWKKL